LIWPVILADAAETDILGTSNWYDRQVLGLGNSFIAQVNAVIEQLGHYPELYQVAFAPVRRAVMHQFPFGIIYHVRPASVLVLGVLPCRADPDLLRQRIAAIGPL
jgi:hypothetical protein